MARGSVIQSDNCCFVCGNPATEVHHILGGTANRAKSDKYGFVVKLCRKHHAEIHRNINGKTGTYLRQMCQRYYEEHIGSREDFIREFGKSRL